MEYIFAFNLNCGRYFNEAGILLKSIYSIDGNVTWRCGEIGIRYALMGKTGRSCMLVRLQPLPRNIAVYYNGNTRWKIVRSGRLVNVGITPCL